MPNNTLFIGLSGRARHGKTTCAEAIVEHCKSIGVDARIYDIGGMILRVCIEEGRLPVGLKRADMTREQLQVLIDVGKEKRELEPNYWMGRLVRAVAGDSPAVAICPNPRLPLEAGAIRAAGGVMVRCTRLNADGSLFISEDRPPNDITETALEFWPADYYLTTKPGQDKFMAAQAVTLYKHLAVERLVGNV